MEMSMYKDVEQGLAEEQSSLRPLLEIDNNNETAQATILPRQSSSAPSYRDFQSSGITTDNDPLTRENLKSRRSLKLFIPEPVPEKAGDSPDSSPSPTITTAASQLQPRRRFRGDRRIRRLNTELLEAVESKDLEEVEELLSKGANPNATCRLALISACHVAALVGGEGLDLLLKNGADKHRFDNNGRTPLHIAVWHGHARQVAMLLDLPDDLCERVETDSMSSETEEELRKLNEKTKLLVNAPCTLGEQVLPKHWKDNIDHDCREINDTFPTVQAGWTPLHVASARARRHCTRLLLAAGADPNATDLKGCTPLDVAGCAHKEIDGITIDSIEFTSVVTQLLDAGGVHNTMRRDGINDISTPLHMAAELECTYVIQNLLLAGASISCHNAEGETPLHVCIRKELEDHLQILATEGVNDIDPLAAAVDVKNRDGYTVLQTAVENGWVSGVCVALEADADLSLKANNGETALHSAAKMDNLDVLNELLGAVTEALIDCQNSSGETPLMKAVEARCTDNVKAILQKGASVLVKLPSNFSVFHIATKLSFDDILQELLKFKESDLSILNDVSDLASGGVAPIHIAVLNNDRKCFTTLVKYGADVRLRTANHPYNASTPLHLACANNFVDIAKDILIDRTTLLEVNNIGLFPLHTAAYHGSRDVIPILLQYGADFASYTDGPRKFRRTAIDMIVNNITRPTDYLENLFDTCISTGGNLKDANCEVVIDYSMLMPRSCDLEQMKVVEAILKTGNRYGQKRILIHPLIESFLFLKWKALLPFFYAILALYSLFVFSLTIFTISVFYYKDSHEPTPLLLSTETWGYFVYSTVFLIVLQELLYMNVKSSRYFLETETWIKFGSLGLAVILPPAVSITSLSSAEWPRHVATAAILFAWIEMMYLLSRFPDRGYYVLMFGKVATNVIKILLTFAFLVIGFSLSFMIQFRSQMPFDGPWSAFVKTMVMMTSEFDYQAIFDDEHTKDLSASIVFVRIIFVIFLVLAAIVLMNLMVGVAVNDINDLEILGNIQRLAKQVQFLGTLDTLVYNKFFSKILPNSISDKLRRKRDVPNILKLYPGKPRWTHMKLLPMRIREAIFTKAFIKKKQMDDETAILAFRYKLDDIYNSIVRQDDIKDIKSNDDESIAKNKRRHDEVIKQLDGIGEEMENLHDKVNNMAEYTREPIEKLNIKIDQLSIEMEAIKEFLHRLESKLGQL